MNGSKNISRISRIVVNLDFIFQNQYMQFPKKFSNSLNVTPTGFHMLKPWYSTYILRPYIFIIFCFKASYERGSEIIIVVYKSSKSNLTLMIKVRSHTFYLYIL